MKKNLLVRIVAAMTVVALCVLAAGCAQTTGSKEVKTDPKVADTQLIAPGTLTVGIDSSLSPFGGESDGKIIGVDVDIAAALASELGLDLQIVDTAGKNAVTMLLDGEVDVAMNVSPTQNGAADIAFIGPYLDNGPALFGKDALDNPESAKGKKVGATTGSLALASALPYCGIDNITEFPTIAEAFDALENGQIDYVSSDAIAGGYLTLTAHEDIGYAVSLANPSGTYIGVAKKNTELQDSILEALHAVAGNGVLQTVVSKWTGVDYSQYVLVTIDQIGMMEIEEEDPDEEADDEAEAEEEE